jgi:alpha/beta superfamily hydrolase
MVLGYDFRGFGQSLGTFDPATTLVEDLQAAVAFVRQQGATSIILLGASMGGMATAKVAASEKVAAVAILSAPLDWNGLSISDEELKATSVPKLFINSEQDSYANSTTHMYNVSSPPKELHLYPGNAHGTDIFFLAEFGDDLTQRLVTFFLKYAPPRAV